MFETALEVVEHVLDDSTGSLSERDYPALTRRFALPHVLTGPKGGRTLRSIEDVQALFEDAAALRAEYGTTDVLRTILSAQFAGPSEISTSHLNCWVKDGIRVAPTYTCHATLILRDGVWQVSKTSYVVTGMPEFSALLAGKWKGRRNA